MKSEERKMAIFRALVWTGLVHGSGQLMEKDCNSKFSSSFNHEIEKQKE
jgi:hypothetical protein